MPRKARIDAPGALHHVICRGIERRRIFWLDGEKPDVLCITHLDLERESDLSRALEIHGTALMADFPNYTNIQPEIYVCEVLTRGK